MSNCTTVVVEDESCNVNVYAPGAAGALGYYGSFYSMVDQSADAIDTPKAMTLNNTAEANGISIVSGSRITFAYDGTYDLQFSAQAHHRGGGGNGLELDIWLAKNGTAVADTATKLIIQKNDYLVPAWDFLLTVEAGDYLELMFRVDNTDITFEHVATAGGVPAIPSLIVTAMQVMYNQVGPIGPTGPTGATGAKGDKGDTGDAATIAAGTTTTLSPGSSATVTNVGTSGAAIFDFAIPAGATGATGTAATIAAGTTTTLSAGSSATVVNAGTSSAAVFNFGIPQGIKGDTGNTGATGPAGADGATVLELQVFS